MAGVALSKGGNVSLSRVAPDLTAVTVGFGWDLGDTDVELDASALGCDPDSQVVDDDWFVFFNNPTAPDGSISHLGPGDGDDARIDLALRTMSGDVDRVVFVVSVYGAESNGQTFARVRDAYVRVVDADAGNELARFALPGDTATETAVVFGEIYRNAGEWKFRAIGQGYGTGLAGVAADFGVNVLA